MTPFWHDFKIYFYLIIYFSIKKTLIKKKNQKKTQVEQVELMTGMDGARKLVEELRSRAKKLEGEIEKQKVVILEERRRNERL